MNSPKLKCIIALLVALAGCLTGEGAAFGEAGVAADEIRGTVRRFFPLPRDREPRREHKDTNRPDSRRECRQDRTMSAHPAR